MIDNPSCHKVQCELTPILLDSKHDGLATKKRTCLKAEWYKLIKLYKSSQNRYKAGVFYKRLSRYFNAIKQIWGHLKDYVMHKTVSFYLGNPRRVDY